MRRYELMLILRPDVADDKAQAVIDRTTRQLIADGGQIIKVAPWGRRRLAYQIERYREGSYHIVLFEAPPVALAEMERTLQITEEVLRHLVTRDERPSRPGRRDGRAGRSSRVTRWRRTSSVISSVRSVSSITSPGPSNRTMWYEPSR